MKAIDWDFIKRIRERLKEPCRCGYDGCHCWSETDVEFLSDYFSVLESSLAKLREQNQAMREVVKNLLKGGQHEGRCTNADNNEYDRGACELHLAASAKRENEAKKALKRGESFSSDAREEGSK